MQQPRFLQRVVGLRPCDAATLEPAAIPMAVAQSKQWIAVAAYDATRSRIILDEVFVGEGEVHDFAQRIVTSIRPSLLLLSTAIVSDAAFVESLTTISNAPRNDVVDEEEEEGNETTMNGGERMNSSRTIPYRVMKSSSYEIRGCKSRIMKLRVESLMRQPRNTDTHDAQGVRHFPLQQTDGQIYNVSPFHALASVIDFESPVQVQALGVLLAFLQKSDVDFDETGILTVNQVVRANTAMHMFVSSDAIAALQIFATEHHPLVVKKGDGNSKEGHSLFSLLDRTQSNAGRQVLREWMLKPLRDVKEISYRQDGVELFMLPDLQTSVGTIFRLMSRIGAVQKILARIQKCVSTPSDYVALLRSLSAAVNIVDTLHNEVLWRVRNLAGPGPHNGDPDNRDPKILSFVDFAEQILDQCDADKLYLLCELLSSIVDDEAMEESRGRLAIREGYSDVLDAQKKKYSRLQETLINCTRAIEYHHPHLQGLVNLVFFPQIGFLVGVDDQINWRAGGLTVDFVFMFQEGHRSYFKCNESRELDASVGDLDAAIKDTEAAIIADMEEAILDCTNELQATFQTLAELDCILSFANMASDLQYVRPEILPESEDCIEIVNGRHPLQEFLIHGEFVANDTFLDRTDRVAVVTGPNFSGKSCYARQVGILVLMAQIGCFIPCEVARIAVVDQILARFSCVETCSVPQSTFQLELTQMGSILQKATSRSLIVVDEFGKGTSPASGISLLTATLRQLCKVRCKVVCTTHFTEVFTTGRFQDGHDGVKALQMAIKTPTHQNDIAIPLFKLQDGISNSSAGIHCARMAGVERSVLERASAIVVASKNQQLVEPRIEILRGDHVHVESQVELVQKFAATRWGSASDRQVNKFMFEVAKLKLRLQS